MAQFARLHEMVEQLDEGEMWLLNKNNTALTTNVHHQENDLFLLTGFSGTSGKLTVTKEETVLWVDGRYIELAKIQFAECPVRLESIGGENQLQDYLERMFDSSRKKHIHKVFYDAGKWSAAEMENKIASYQHIKWVDQPVKAFAIQAEDRKLDLITQAVAGVSVEAKLKWSRQQMEKDELHILCNPEDIAWLMNLRADDYPYSRGVGGKVLVSRHYVAYFGDLDAKDVQALGTKFQGWIISGREQTWVKALKHVLEANPNLMLVMEKHNRPGAINYRSLRHVLEFWPENKCRFVNRSIAEIGRIQKNRRESTYLNKYGHQCAQVMNEAIEVMQSHIDRNRRMGENDLKKKIFEIARRYGASRACFEPIVASGVNSALPHHQGQKDKSILPGELVVLDIGFYFGDGSYATDMTRTVLAGTRSQPTFLQKRIYTHVLMAFLKQIHVRFKKGELKAYELDQMGRSILKPLEKEGFKFVHSTGHGLGIQDHELAITISASSRLTLQPGFCFSIEPGVYGSPSSSKCEVFGVRLEDIVLVESEGEVCVQKSMNPCAFEKRCIDFGIMDALSTKYYEEYMESVIGGQLPSSSFKTPALK